MLKRASLGLVAGLMAISCAQADDTAPLPKPTPTPIEIVDGTQGGHWRKINPDHVLVLQTRYGDVFIELNPAYAPGHVDRMLELTEKRALNGIKFYRVIDGFMAQAGLNEDSSDWPPLEIEIEQDMGDADNIHTLDNDDLYAPQVGFENGFAIGMNPDTNKKWLLHCPGYVAMARGNDPHSGGTDFYITFDAQRYLDRNMTVFGRVLSGMQYVQKVTRGDKDVASGVIDPPNKADEIFSVKLLSSVPEETRPAFEVMKSDTAAFQNVINAQRIRKHEFFFNTPPQVIDVCDVDVPTARIEN